jgi:serine/threonine protein kinase
MPLRPGTRIGSYTIEAPLGMGEVYRARDSRLGRNVALKVLSELFALDVDCLDRLMREAHVLASLNHPNIAAIYGMEETGGPGGGPFTRVSSNGAGRGWLAGRWVARALWSPTTNELFYRRGDELLGVTFHEADGRFIVTEERPLFRLPAFELVGISRDASRFLLAVAQSDAPPRGIDVVLNWPGQLK